MGASLTFIDIPALLSYIETITSAVLTTHVNPDGDALGSEAAFYRFLTARGKEVRIINADPVPENLGFLAAGGMFETWDAAVHTDVLREADAIFCLDFNQSNRVRGIEEVMLASAARRIVIDHHLEPKSFADMYLTDIDASSTAEIVYTILVEGDFPIDRETALGLYTGIMTDSGSFRFERTTPRLHRITADLLETGLDPTAIHRRVFDDYPIGRTLLLGRVLAGIEQSCDARVSIMTVTRAMLDETGTGLEDVENMVNYGLAIRGVELTALLTEVEDGWKISFRSGGTISVNDIASEFGGGGHRLAAGAHTGSADLSALRKRILERLCAALPG